MNNQEAKEKAIREAWGDHWEKIKDKVDSDGYVEFFPYGYKGKLDNRFNTDEQYEYAPLALRAISSNNGWNRIDGPDALPRQDGKYVVLGHFGKVEEWFYSDSSSVRALWLGSFTHWRPVVELPMPVY